jgi:hypothetical protein
MLTKEQRAEISRQNGRKSQGPKSPETRAKVARNATTTGLRARTYPLPHEDAQNEAERAGRWHNFYLPQSPLALHLTNECVHAEALAERSHAYRQATIDQQVREADQRVKKRRRERLNYHVGQLPVRPAEAMAQICSFATGCGWAAACYSNLINAVKSQGVLTPQQFTCAFQLSGASEPDDVSHCPKAYAVWIAHLGTQGAPQAALLAEALKHANRPVALRAVPAAELAPGTPEECAARLVTLLEREVAWLKTEEARLHTEVDEPEWREEMARAGILTEADAKRVTRSHGESRSTMLRCGKQLLQTLKKDAEEAHQAREQEPAPACTDSADSRGSDDTGDRTGPVLGAVEQGTPIAVVPAPCLGPEAVCEAPSEADEAPVVGSDPSPGVPADRLPIEPDFETEASSQPVGGTAASDAAQLLTGERQKREETGPDRGGKTAPAERGLSLEERRRLKKANSRSRSARESSPQSAMPHPSSASPGSARGVAAHHLATTGPSPHGPPVAAGRSAAKGPRKAS